MENDFSPEKVHKWLIGSSASLVIRKLPTKPQWDFIAYLLEWLKLKRMTILLWWGGCREAGTHTLINCLVGM